jgi:amidase
LTAWLQTLAMHHHKARRLGTENTMPATILDPAQLAHHARRVHLRLSRHHRGTDLLLTALNRLQPNPHLNAIAFKGYETPIPPSDHAVGFFSGVPTFIKDMVQIAGMPTNQGTDAWDPRPATRDGAFVKKFRSLGVTPLGVTRMSEFGFNAVAEHPRLGPVPNPWNTDLTPGGSSSGSAALIASGAVPFAHAVDGGGSIRIPASCTGLIGLKPSRGRLPLDADLQYAPIRIACNGILTRSVRDTAAFYREMERHRPARSLLPIGDVTGPDARRLRIAVATRSVLTDCTPEVREETSRVAAVLEGLGTSYRAHRQGARPGLVRR